MGKKLKTVGKLIGKNLKKQKSDKFILYPREKIIKWLNSDDLSIGKAQYHLFFHFTLSTYGGGGIGAELTENKHPQYNVPREINRGLTAGMKENQITSLVQSVGRDMEMEYIFQPWVKVYTERVHVGKNYYVSGRKVLQQPDNLKSYNIEDGIIYIFCNKVKIFDTPQQYVEKSFYKFNFNWIKPDN